MEHHKAQSFEEEYLALLAKHEVEYDKKLVRLMYRPNGLLVTVSFGCGRFLTGGYHHRQRMFQPFGLKTKDHLQQFQYLPLREPGGLTHPLPGSKAPVIITEKRKRPGCKFMGVAHGNANRRTSLLFRAEV